MQESLRADFDRLMDTDTGCAWCRCVGWWVPTWDDRGERTAEENRAQRDLATLGARRVEAHPRAGAGLEPGEIWTGPVELYLEQGFSPFAERSNRIAMVRELEAS